MTDPMILIDACGTCLNDAVLLASPADEWFDETGRVSPKARTLFFRLNGGAPKHFATVPFPVRKAWSSRHATYFSADSDYLYVTEGPDWSRPRRETVVAGEPTDWGVWGISGHSAAGDTVFLGGRDCVYLRRAGVWERFRAPDGSGRINRVHGLRPDELYMGSRIGLLRFDGATLSSIVTPDEQEIDDVYVLSEEELLATTGSDLFRWSDTAGWTEIDTSFSRHGNFASLSGKAFVADWRDGVFEIEGSTTRRVAALECRSLLELTDGIIALSRLTSRQHAFFDGSRWRELTLPECRRNGGP